MNGEGEPKAKPRGRKPKDQALSLSGDQFEGLINLPEDDESDGSKKDIHKDKVNNEHRALVFCQMKSYM